MDWVGMVLALAGGFFLRWVTLPTRKVRTDPLDIPYASCGRCGDLVSAYCKDHRAEHATKAMQGWQ